MSPFVAHPYISIGLVALWLLLTGFSTGNLILGIMIAGIAVMAMRPLELPRSKVKLWPLFRLFGIVFVDIIKSNIAVATMALAGPDAASEHSGLLDMEIDLDDRNALCLLALVLTATPGTAWLEYDPKTRKLLLHILDLRDPEEWRRVVQHRYVRLLKEAFE